MFHSNRFLDRLHFTDHEKETNAFQDLKNYRETQQFPQWANTLATVEREMGRRGEMGEKRVKKKVSDMAEARHIYI